MGQIVSPGQADPVGQFVQLGMRRSVHSSTQSMNNTRFFVSLAHQLANYDEAVVLSLLVALDATEQPLRSTAAKLSAIHLDNAISPKRVQRATDSLVVQSLVRTRVHPNRWTEYTVDANALTTLLSRPLPEAPFLPGLSEEPISFLTRLAAPAAAAVPRAVDPDTASTHPEDDQ